MTCIDTITLNSPKLFKGLIWDRQDRLYTLYKCNFTNCLFSINKTKKRCSKALIMQYRTSQLFSEKNIRFLWWNHRRKKEAHWGPNLIMQLPDGLGSGFFLCESVFCTVLHDALIVSATSRWVSVFWAACLGPWCRLAFWFCFFSGVSPTAVTPVTVLCWSLVNKHNLTHQACLLRRV